MIRMLIVVAAIATSIRDPKPVTFFEGVAWLGLFALLEIADEIRDLRKAQTPAQPQVCDAQRLGNGDAASLWCVRRSGHYGPHSTSRYLTGGAVTWEKTRGERRRPWKPRSRA